MVPMSVVVLAAMGVLCDSPDERPIGAWIVAAEHL
jgi:hypothetical protein